MTESIILAPRIIGMLVSALAVLLVSKYALKEKKNGTIAWMFVLFFGVALLLIADGLYEELVVMQNSWLKFDALVFILLAQYIIVAFGIFPQKHAAEMK